MKQILIVVMSIFVMPLTLMASELQVIDIDIEGMSCKFCAHSVQKKMTKLSYVKEAKVNIDKKKAHVIIKEGEEANIDELKQKIINSGFKPVKVIVN